MTDTTAMQPKTKRPRDVNQLAASIIRNATEGPDQDSRNPAAVELGRLGGAKGGKVRASRMTPEQRSESAKKAASARWEKKAKKFLDALGAAQGK